MPIVATPDLLPIREVAHLIKAAEHLDAAGLHDEARKIRDRADQEKALAIKTLRAELYKLLSPTQNTPQVMLKLRVIELSCTKIEKLGFDFSKLSRDNVAIASPTVVPHTDWQRSLRSLQGPRSCPSVLAYSPRPITFSIYWRSFARMG